MATKAEMITNVRFLIAEDSTVRIEDTDVSIMLDRGYIRVCRLTKALQLTTPAYAAIGVNQAVYPLATFAAGGARIFEPTRVKIAGAAANNGVLRFMESGRLWRLYPSWETDSNYPTIWTQLDDINVGISPCASSAWVTSNLAAKLYLYGYCTPDASLWVSGTPTGVQYTTPQIHIDLHPLIEYHAAATLLTNIIEDEAAKWKENKFGQLFWEGISLRIQGTEQNRGNMSQTKGAK